MPLLAEYMAPSETWRLWWLVLLCCACCSVAAPARAERGTHFVGEAGLGVSLPQVVRPAFDLTLGAGGRLSRSPLRGYALTQFAFTQSGSERDPSWGEERRKDVSIGGGVRLYVALPDRLRLHVDGLLNAAFVRVQVMQPSGRVLSERDWYPQFVLAPGLQYRLYRELSIGVRAKWLVSKTGYDQLRAVRGAERRHPWSLLAGATWHF